ncbi:putative transposase/invertase (TIGR01784 family) [Treponema putidum]|nr:putative transposase/invertase (TIGR01784 family) [Treponema putidum]
MLVAEYDYDTDIAVQRAEERQIAFAEGIEQGIERGIEQGIEQGFSDGAYRTKLETAKLMRMHNYPIAEICTMTGLTKEEVESV